MKHKFSAGLTELLKIEQELKGRTTLDAKIPLEQRYQLLLNEVTEADNITSLSESRSGPVSLAGSHSSRTSGFHSRRWSLRTVDAEKDKTKRED